MQKIEKKFGLFDFLKNISETKEEMFDLEDFDKKYNPFMINRFLASDPGCVLLANIMSQFSHLPKKVQYGFYLYGIDIQKRYLKYSGKAKDKTQQLKDVIRYYNCTQEQGIEYLSLLSKEQVKKIKAIYKPRVKKIKRK